MRKNQEIPCAHNFVTIVLPNRASNASSGSIGGLREVLLPFRGLYVGHRIPIATVAGHAPVHKLYIKTTGVALALASAFTVTQFL